MTISEMARKLGRQGGLKRAEKLSNTRRSEIARIGAQARMESFRIAKAMRNNFDYLEAIRKLQNKR